MFVAALTVFSCGVTIGLPCLHEKQAYGTHNPPNDKNHRRQCRMLLLVIRAHRQHAIWLGIVPASLLLWPERAM